MTLASRFHEIGGFAYILVGLMAWHRRPHNRTGVLMVAAGLAWYLVDLKNFDSRLLFTIGDITGNLVYAFIAQMALAFPSGQLQSERERLLVILTYVWVVVGTFPILFAPATVCHCTQDLLNLHPNVHEYDIATVIQQAINITVAIAVGATVIRHRIGATSAAKRAMAPVIWASGPILFIVVALNAGNAVFPSWLNQILPSLTPVALMTLPVSFLVGLVRSRLATLAIGTLVVELTQNTQHDGLREAIAKSLGDHTVEIAYVVAGDEWVDGAGKPIELPKENSRRAATLLERNGSPVAALIHDRSLQNDPTLVSQVAAASSLAIENERLRVELIAKLAEVQESRTRLVEVADTERRKLERDLHDGAQQQMISLALMLGSAKQKLTANDVSGADAEIGKASTTLQLATKELRDLAAGIRPAVLTDSGLQPALEALVERASIPTSLDCDLTARCSDAVEAAAYFSVSEAVTNIAKHAGATRATIDARIENSKLLIVVTDDGNGEADVRKGTGLRGLKDRLAALGGTLSVITNPGAGTTVRISLPCE